MCRVRAELGNQASLKRQSFSSSLLPSPASPGVGVSFHWIICDKIVTVCLQANSVLWQIVYSVCSRQANVHCAPAIICKKIVASGCSTVKLQSCQSSGVTLALCDLVMTCRRADSDFFISDTFVVDWRELHYSLIVAL